MLDESQAATSFGIDRNHSTPSSPFVNGFSRPGFRSSAQQLRHWGQGEEEVLSSSDDGEDDDVEVEVEEMGANEQDSDTGMVWHHF